MKSYLVIDDVIVWNKEIVTPIPLVPPVIPSPIPQPIPSPRIGMWDLHEISLWPVPPLRGPVISVSFVPDAIRFPNGVEIGGVDESQSGTGKDYVISDVKGSFVPLGGNKNAQKIGAGSTMGPIYLRFGPARPRSTWGFPLPSLDVALTPGQIYWINVRATDKSNTEINTQFVATKRMD